MKGRRLGWIAAVVMLALAGCGKDRNAPIDYVGDPTPSDSLIYYYGQLKGAAYKNQAAYDTVMMQKEERKRFLEGLHHGLDAVVEDNDTYNRGLQEGIRLALQLYSDNRRLGVNLDRDLLYASISYALEHEKTIDTGEAAAIYHEVMTRLEKESEMKAARDRQVSLQSEAAALKMKKVADELYVADSNPGSGGEVKRGDIVFVSVNYQLKNGRNLQMPSSEILKVGGPTMSEVMTKALTRMRKGGASQYASTAGALFGSRAEQIRLKQEDVVLFSVTVTDVENPDTMGSRREDISI